MSFDDIMFKVFNGFLPDGQKKFVKENTVTKCDAKWCGAAGVLFGSSYGLLCLDPNMSTYGLSITLAFVGANILVNKAVYQEWKDESLRLR